MHTPERGPRALRLLSTAFGVQMGASIKAMRIVLFISRESFRDGGHHRKGNVNFATNLTQLTLIKSISGIRGTIGGLPGEGLTPIDIVKFTSAYGAFLRQRNGNQQLIVVIGRDARTSGAMCSALVSATLSAMGIRVLDCGLSTTPTVEVEVTEQAAHGGIILTASHNPGQWNALKLLNERGEFISDSEGRAIIAAAEAEDFSFAEVNDLGQVIPLKGSAERHIAKILALPAVNRDAIAAAGFRVAIDCVNSTGGIFLPPLLKALGVSEIVELYTEPNGLFPHNPEPLPEHLTELSATVRSHSCHVGFVVDPDVDRLAIICEDGSMFGEEYTLVAVADYMLSLQSGNTVSNLSSTRALGDVTGQRGGQYHPAAVGEVNVVEMMKKTNAIIGGEGNGGIILPELHYGRDALVGIALFLSLLAREGKTVSELRKTYPAYWMSKQKVDLPKGGNPDQVLKTMAERYAGEKINLTDGVKIDFAQSWVHLRKSNTEPIVRIYSEAGSQPDADALASRFKAEIVGLFG